MERRIEIMCTNPLCGKPARIERQLQGRTINGNALTKKVYAKKCECGAEIKPMHT